jgi:hypothetical protein
MDKQGRTSCRFDFGIENSGLDRIVTPGRRACLDAVAAVSFTGIGRKAHQIIG